MQVFKHLELLFIFVFVPTLKYNNAVIDLIKNDWEKLPQNVRYLFAFGFLLVFNSWLLDHWGNDGILPYKYLGAFDVREISYNIGMSLIYLGTIVLIVRQILNLPKLISNFKTKYPVKKIGKSFDLVWFSGKLILFDHKANRYYHVYPWETAEDLGFVSFGDHVQDHFPNPANTKIKLSSGKTLDTTKYKNAGSINTQR